MEGEEIKGRGGRFLLFGMGPRRRKLLYAEGGRLLDALTLEPVKTWQAREERFEPHEYRVRGVTRDDRPFQVLENSEGVWVESDGELLPVTRGNPVHLPRFEGNQHAPLLRALHAELLINIMPFGPVPNLWVYPRPWYRDAAMSAMCLQKTNNLHLLEEWVMGLHKPFDYNNAGNEEPDNLGQALYLLSLFGATKHPLISEALKAAARHRRGDHLAGFTDGREHPVYQTKWLKFGLESLGMPHERWVIPPIADSYSALFWMAYRDEHVPCERFDRDQLRLYPYLNWAEAHFYREPPPEPLPDLNLPPLTREERGSEAEHWRTKSLAKRSIVPTEWVENKTAAPHTWHAAEMFLYLTDEMDKTANVLAK